MHNFTKPAKTVDDSLKSVGKGLHSPKKEFFALNNGLFERAYENYDVLADQDELNRLTKLWPEDPLDNEDTNRQKAENRHLSNQLYNDDRPFVNDHWEYLTRQNDGETLFCPICGLHECEEMDHFVPRDEDEFPEYSAHLSNLIPLCHNCNHKKSNKFLDENGNRIFFNAFYDLITNRDILVGEITVSSTDGMPQIEVKLNPSLNVSNKPDMYILSTITELNLMPRFIAKAKLCFKSEINRLIRRKGQEWESIKKEMKPLAIPMENNPDIVSPAVLGAIADSPVMESWFNSL